MANASQLQKIKDRQSRILQDVTNTEKKTTQEKQQAAVRFALQKKQSSITQAARLLGEQRKRTGKTLTEGVNPTPRFPGQRQVSPITPLSPNVDSAIQRGRMKDETAQAIDEREGSNQAMEAFEQQRMAALLTAQQEAQFAQIQAEQQIQERGRVAGTTPPNLEYIGRMPTPLKHARDRGWTWLYWIQIATLPLLGLLGLAYALLVLAMIVSYTQFGKRIIGEFRGPSPYPFSHKVIGYLIIAVLGFIWGTIYLLAFTQFTLFAYIISQPVEAALKFGETLVKLITG